HTPSQSRHDSSQPERSTAAGPVATGPWGCSVTAGRIVRYEPKAQHKEPGSGHEGRCVRVVPMAGPARGLQGRSGRPGAPRHSLPDKYTAYTATTLAWVGDPATEAYAREIIARLRGAEYDGKWPRRIATANLDLALTLLATNRLDEAVGAAHEAISSGRVVPSSHWRAVEGGPAVEERQLAGAQDLREGDEGHPPGGEARPAATGQAA